MAREKDASNSNYQISFLIFVAAVALTQIVPFLERTMRSWERQLNQMILRQQFQVEYVDDFISDPRLLQSLQNDTLWRACDKVTKGGIRFWYYPQNEPVNVFEEVAIRIWKNTSYWDNAISYNYWCNIIDEDDDRPNNHMEHPWHTDRDEDVLDQERRFIFPLMGSVYYGFNAAYTGGSFHMIDSVPYKMGTRSRAATDDCHEKAGMCLTNPHLFDSRKSDEALFVETKFNRLLYANVTHFHKVSKVFSGKRYALAVNANHWLPYEVKRAPTNDEMIEMTSQELKQRHRTFGLE